MRNISRRFLGVLGIGAAAALLTSAPLASADAAPKAEVLVIHGTTCDAPSVDPAIGEVPPLKYNCYKLLEKRQLSLSQTAPSTMALANGRTFQVVYHGQTNDKPPRFKVATSISKPDGSGYNPLAEISAEPGRKFHVGGFSYQNGSLLLAIRIVP